MRIVKQAKIIRAEFIPATISIAFLKPILSAEIIIKGRRDGHTDLLKEASKHNGVHDPGHPATANDDAYCCTPPLQEPVSGNSRRRSKDQTSRYAYTGMREEQVGICRADW